ncbi:uncharacterized protein KZ484_003266 [Pholidichthys leucotaenia]
MVSRKEAEVIRNFVCSQLRQESCFSTLTLGILKKRYLEHVKYESLSPDAKTYMKKVVKEELMKMEDSRNQEEIIKPQKKRKRESVKEEDEDESRVKKIQSKRPGLSSDSDNEGCKTGSDENENKKQRKSESDEEEQEVRKFQRKMNGKNIQQLESGDSSDEDSKKVNGSDSPKEMEEKTKMNEDTTYGNETEAKKISQSDDEKSDGDEKSEKSDRIKGSESSDSEKEEKNGDSDTDSSSLSSLDDKKDTRVENKNTQEKMSKSKKTVKKKKGNTNQKNEDKRVVRLKRFIFLCGVRKNYKKLLDSCRSTASKVAVLKKELEDLGLKGTPTIKKCKKVQMKREMASELAHLHVSNIIETQGRPKRQATFAGGEKQPPSAYQRTLPSGSDSDQEDGTRRRTSDWANLKGIISDDGDRQRVLEALGPAETFSECAALMTEHFTARKDVMAQRFMFYQCRQQEDELLTCGEQIDTVTAEVVSTNSVIRATLEAGPDNGRHGERATGNAVEDGALPIEDKDDVIVTEETSRHPDGRWFEMVRQPSAGGQQPTPRQGGLLPHGLDVSDWVRIKHLNRTHKLQPFWTGPLQIIKWLAPDTFWLSVAFQPLQEVEGRRTRPPEYPTPRFPAGMDDDSPNEDFAELKTRPIGGWGIAQIAAGTGLAVYAMWVGILQPGFRKVPLRLQVPYIPASKAQVRNVMTLLKGRKGGLVDLGSGDGRIVLEANQRGFRPAVGYELNPWLIYLARFHALRAGHNREVSYRREDLWKVDLTKCKNVTVFLAPSVLSLLQDKLQAELPDDALVIAGRFPFPDWRPCMIEGHGVDRAWAYNMRAQRHHILKKNNKPIHEDSLNELAKDKGFT